MADGRVRQALLHATDTEKIVETIFSVNSPQATLILARTATGCADHSEKRKFDPELAAKLPEEAGGPCTPNRPTRKPDTDRPARKGGPV